MHQFKLAIFKEDIPSSWTAKVRMFGEPPTPWKVFYDSVSVNPAGVFSVSYQREEYRFRQTLDGTMTFYGADFDIIHSQPECSQFVIGCNFDGKIWYGYFTKKDCEINLSKGYLEVKPTPNDDYKDFLPYIKEPMNLLEDRTHNGKKYAPDVWLHAYRWYQKETITEVITDPYDGPVEAGKSWVGYSVNDWVSGAEGPYIYANGKRNSLIHKVTGNRLQGSTLPTLNVLLWLDHEGYNAYIRGEESAVQGTANFYNAVRATLFETPSMYTLEKVENFYNDSDEWIRAELTYSREVWDGRGTPPTGYFASFYKLLSEGENIFEDSPQGYAFAQNLHGFRDLPGGWVYSPSEEKWLRRPIDIARPDRATAMGSVNYGDGTWFHELSEPISLKEGYKRVQELATNRYVKEVEGVDNWYPELYGYISRRGRFHRIPTLINKYLLFINEKAQGQYPLELQSEYLNNPVCPYLNSSNAWYSAAIVPNSDLKRIDSTEKADKEEHSFEDFMETMCRLMNAGWAIINGEFVFEHISYFDNGLTYNSYVDIDCEEDVDSEGECVIINPASIKNLALNRNFLRLSNSYLYERPEMAKNEVFVSTSGREPEHNNTRIFYDTPCANNLPGQNESEISIDTTTDAEYVISGGDDSGFTVLLTNVQDIQLAGENKLIGSPWRFPPAYRTADRDLFFSTWYFVRDDNEVYRMNPDFTLENIVKAYHRYGRSFKQGSVNGDSLGMTSRHYILQDMFFPWRDEYGRKELNPYHRILSLITDEGQPEIIRTGRINSCSFNSRTGIWDVHVGFFDSNEKGYEPPIGGGYADLRNSPAVVVDFYRHVQISPSSQWIVNHGMRTRYPFRPVVYRAGQELEYGYLRVISPDAFVLGFEPPINGEVYTLSFEATDFYQFAVNNSSTVTVVHNLGSQEVIPSVIIDEDGNEIEYESFEVVDGNTVTITFSQNVTASGRIGVFDGTVFTSESEVQIVRTGYPLRPFILQMGKNIGYDYNLLTDTLVKIGFSQAITGVAIVKQHE